jgi:hypothetical protein
MAADVGALAHVSALTFTAPVLLMISLMQKDFCDDQHRQEDQSVRHEGGLRQLAQISISLLQNVNHITA